eukprot:7632832-Pyramimonas_sp.AAC.1
MFSALRGWGPRAMAPQRAQGAGVGPSWRPPCQRSWRLHRAGHKWVRPPPDWPPSQHSCAQWRPATVRG